MQNNSKNEMFTISMEASYWYQEITTSWKGLRRHEQKRSVRAIVVLAHARSTKYLPRYVPTGMPRVRAAEDRGTDRRIANLLGKFFCDQTFSKSHSSNMNARPTIISSQKPSLGSLFHHGLLQHSMLMTLTTLERKMDGCPDCSQVALAFEVTATVTQQPQSRQEEEVEAAGAEEEALLLADVRCSRDQK